jgi:hypothetical protein
MSLDMNIIEAPSPALNLSAVIHALRALVGAWGGRGLFGAAVGWLLHRRLGEIVRRMEGLAARFQAGRLRVGGVRGSVTPVVRVRGERIWPRAFGWLVIAARHEAAVFGIQLRMILAQPEMVALLAATPQAARVLRPLCRMLAVETSLLRPAGEVAAAAAVGVVPAALVPAALVSVRKPRVKPDLGRVPIPRGVMAAVRRERDLKR